MLRTLASLPTEYVVVLAVALGGALLLGVRAAVEARRGKRGRAIAESLGTLSGLAFVVLTFIVGRTPQLRGTYWTLRDTTLRASAVVTGTVFALVLVAAHVPLVLDALERRGFSSFVSARHVRSHKSGFLTVISVLSICGVAVSSCALSSVVSVMGGFTQDLKRKILGHNAHVVIDTEAQVPWEGGTEVLDRVRRVSGVVAATPVVHGEVMMTSHANLAGVIVRGVDPETIDSVVDLRHNIEVGRFEYLTDPERLRRLPPDEVIGIGPGGEPWRKGPDMPALDEDLDPEVRAVIDNAPPLRPAVIVGRELAKTLHIYVGDEVTIVSPLGELSPVGLLPRTKRMRVAAVFYTGMYEYDASHVYMLMDEAREFFQLGERTAAIDIKVRDGEKVDGFAERIGAAIERDDLRVRDWREINRNLFSALKLERFATFVILSLAIAVASFCILCTLLLMVTEKSKDIAILKSLGASDIAVLRTFVAEGLLIGGMGTLFGITTGLALCAGLSWFGLRLDPDVYYIDRLPIAVSATDFLAVCGSAIVICMVATLLPAFAASRVRPVEGLRYE